MAGNGNNGNHRPRIWREHKTCKTMSIPAALHPAAKRFALALDKQDFAAIDALIAELRTEAVEKLLADL